MSYTFYTKNIKTKNSSYILYPLFTNLLMKHGKKTRALEILEKSIELFSIILYKRFFPFYTKSFLAYNPKSGIFKKKANNIKKNKILEICNYKRIGKYFHFLKHSLKQSIPLYFYFFYKEKEKSKDIKKPRFFPFFPCSFKQLKNKKTLYILEKNSMSKGSKNEQKEKFTKNFCLWYKLNKKHTDRITLAQNSTFLFYFYKAISNVKPPLECRSKRFGGSNRQIPATVSEHRQWGFAIRWIIQAADSLKNSKKTRLKKNYTTEKGYNSTTKDIKLLYKKSFENFGGKETQNYKKNYLGGEKRKEFCSTKNKKTYPFFCFFLAEALLQAYYNRGSAIEKRNLWIETAITNRAFLRYRWW